MENQTGKKVKLLQNEKGIEFCIGEFDEFCKDKDIAKHHTIRHTPQ